MIASEKTSEISVPSTDFEHQALVITVPNHYNETVSPQSSLSELSRNTTPSLEVKNSLRGSSASPNDEMKIHEISSGAPQLLKMILNFRIKIKL